MSSNAPLLRMMGPGERNEKNRALSPSAGYTGPVFYGGYGRSHNGSVDDASIRNNSGEDSLDVLNFTEGTIGHVDQLYGLVAFRSDAFAAPYKGRPISLATTEALTLRTYTGYIPEQIGWVYFYIEIKGEAFVSSPFSYTQDTVGEWGTKTISVGDPRKVRWTRAVFRGDTTFLAGERPPASPDFDAVDAVGFVFHSAGMKDSEKNTARFMTDMFIVSAK